MSGRNISDICRDAERRWAAKLIRREVNDKLQSLNQYIETLNSRLFNFVWLFENIIFKLKYNSINHNMNSDGFKECDDDK